MKKKLRVIVSLALSTILLSSVFASAKSYTYNYKKEAVLTPEAVTVATLVDDEYAGWGALSGAEDIQISSTGEVYIADTLNGRIVHLGKDYRFIDEIKSVINENGEEIPLRNPKGVFCHEDLGEIYIADTSANCVYVVGKDRVIKKILKATSEETFKTDFIFLPEKVGVDYAGRVFIVAENVFDGLMEFDIQGKFVGYAGANKVTPSLRDIFYRLIATEESRSSMQKLIPVEFDNIDIDANGFIYTVTKIVSQYDPAKDNPIRKQTVKGINILRSGDLGVPIGDYNYPFADSLITGPSAFVDISVNNEYGYSVIDSKRNRVFVYNDAGEILFVFGGKGETKGYFSEPIAIESYEDKILVLDKLSGSVTVFQFTDYGKLIIDAENSYLAGKYDESIEKWQQVLKMNSGLDIAYVGIGKNLIVKSEYKEAMEYLKTGGETTYYSKAFGAYRKELIGNYIYWILGAALVLVVLIALYLKFFHKKLAEKNPFKDKDWYKGLKFSKYIMFHPFDGFWDMQHEKKGHMSSALIIYGALAVSMVLKEQFTGFAFGGTGKFNLISVVGMVVLPAFLWCLCNWSVTTLFDGDGSPKAIIMATAYALVPFTLFQIPIAILTNLLSGEEASIITVLNIIAIAWSVFLIFCGMLTIHQYTGGQTILTIIVTVLGMFLLLFLVVLLYNLLQQLIIFVISIYNEIVIRM